MGWELWALVQVWVALRGAWCYTDGFGKRERGQGTGACGGEERITVCMQGSFHI
jgi:hypothetical protein